MVENDAYMMELSCYIHRNPLRAGMVRRLIDYRWSSYPVCAYGRKGPPWLKTDLILSFFTGRDKHRGYREKVQNYAGEEDWLWENFRYGMLLGSEQFVDKIRSLRVGAVPHKEITQQRNVLASIDPMEAVRKSSALLGRDMQEYRAGHRVHGEVKEDRDVMIYALWATGLFSNGQIGRLFGISYSAVSHVIAEVKGNRSDPVLQSKLRKINSQFKISPR